MIDFLEQSSLSPIIQKMDRGWGGLPMMFPSKTAMDYLWHRTDILPEEDIAPGAHYRARRAMLDNVSLLTKYIHTFF